MAMTDADFFARLRGVIGKGWLTIPDHPGYRGTGGPGLMLKIDDLGHLYSKSQRFDVGAI